MPIEAKVKKRMTLDHGWQIMDRESLKNSSIPLCQFGPGGDFAEPWNGPGAQMPASPINQVLTTLAELLGVTIESEQLAEIACVWPQQKPVETNTEPAVASKERVEDAANRRTDNHHPASVGSADAHRGLSKQPLLFGDDGGTGRRAKRKPAHSVRTHRGPARKKAHHAVERQGTLFTLNGAWKTPHRQGSAA